MNAAPPNAISQDASPLEATIYPKQTPGFYAGLSVYWFAHSFLWAGLITIVIQRMVEQMAGAEKDLVLGRTLAVGAVISTLVSVLAGTMSDRSVSRYGKRRPYIIIGTALSLPALLYFPYVTTIAGLTLAFCLLQLFINIGAAPYEALVPDMVPRERQGTAAAYMGMSGLFAQLSGLMLCGLLIEKEGGLSIIMTTIVAVLAAGMLWTGYFVKEKPASRDESIHVEKGWAAVKSLLRAMHVNPRQYPDFMRLIASRFVINTGFYTANGFLYYYIKDTLDAPNPVAFMTQLVVLSLVAGLLGNFPAGILSDRTSKKTVVYWAAGITACGVLLFVATKSLNVAYAGAFLFGAGFGAFQAVDWALATNLLPEHDEAKFLGLWNMAFTIPQIIAPIIGGTLAYFFNTRVEAGFGYRVVLFLVIIYLFAGALIIKPIKERVVLAKAPE